MIPLSISFLNPKILGFLFSTKNSLPGDIRKIKLQKTVGNLKLKGFKAWVKDVFGA